MDETEILVRSAKARDPAAMAELLERHLQGLRAFIRLQVDGQLRAKESASDLVQSVCLEVLEHLGQFEYRGENSFRRWLYTAALNKVRQKLQFYHAQKRDIAREVPLDPAARMSQLQAAYATIATPSQEAIAHELVARVEAAFDRLPESHRQVLALSRIAGLPHAEIAAHLGRSEGAVRTLLSRALARLSALLYGPG